MIQSLFDLPETTKYLNRIGAEPRSLLKAVVREEVGDYWTDISIIKFDKDGTVTVLNMANSFSPTTAEAEAIKQEFSAIDWPSNKHIDLTDKNLPSLFVDADNKDKFVFHDVNGNVVMLQVKKVQKGKKSYIPITFWSDGQYRFTEPDGLLPLYGLDKVKGQTTVIIHEGAGAAKAGQDIADGKIKYHPWEKELSNAAHVGFVGGALSPLRTDWSVLKRNGITRAYIVPDNDKAGRSAVPSIAKELRMPTFFIQFNDQWPSGFDLADEFPKNLFSKIGENRYYTGPSFREVTNPGTWMTDVIEVDDGGKKPKKISVLREHAIGQWIWAEELNLFVNSEMPDIVHSSEGLDSALLPFSDTRKTSELILGAFIGRTPKFAYNPATKGRRIISAGTSAINLYIPPDIKPADGDCTPWLDYLEYLVPNEAERYEVMKWCATLIARPDIRMHYALLMISEQTGTGKSTLGEILARLVGQFNASFPSESEISEQFNSWLARKRLVVVNEIYQGQSFKTANKLKSYITDRTVTMRMMFRDGVSIENYAHFYCCSNSSLALLIEDTDRRWYIPTLTEVKRPVEDWQKFFDWLESGGYSIIAGWAEKFGDYVMPGEPSPITDRKKQMIYESLSIGQREMFDLCESILDRDVEVALSMEDVFEWATRNISGPKYDKPREYQKIARQKGFEVWSVGTDRMSVHGKLQAIFLSPKLYNKVKKFDRQKMRDVVRDKILTVGSVLSERV